MNNEKELIDRVEWVEKRLGHLSSPNSQPDFLGVADEIDLLQLLLVLWDGKWIIAAVTILFTLSACLLAFSLPNIYHANTLLTPSAEADGGGLGKAAGQLGGLASLAGIDISGGRGADRVAIALEVLKSREFVSDFITHHDLLVPLMAIKEWDSATKELKIDPELYDVEKKTWVRKPNPVTGLAIPSMQEAYKKFSGILKVSQDKKTSFVTIGLDFHSPEIARQWIDWLVKDLNEVIKNRDVAEARRSIDYLEDQLQKTSVANMRSIFYGLIEEQTKTIMFSESREEYVFKTIDRAIAPEQKDKPKRSLILVGGFALGLFFAVAFLFVKAYFWRKEADVS